MHKPIYIDIHILQSVPPSNINRDDTGSPKTARFGGVTRARVSSQAWKKATRDLFPELLDEQKIGQRTKHAVDLIAERIRQKKADIAEVDATKMAGEALGATGIKVTNAETGYLLFLSPQQADELANLSFEARESGVKLDQKVAKEVLDPKKRPVLNAVDIALFGRMVADAPELNVDASVQVAHAIGVGRAETEFDYFTALDDRAPEDNAGAAMINTTEFTSATLYRYANIDVYHLCENLGSVEAACEGIAAFLKAFIVSMPTGKQNSFANRTLPSAVVVQLRDTQPVSLVNAFERPIVPHDGKSQVELACEALVEQERALDKAFDVTPEKTYVVCGSSDATGIEALSSDGAIGLKDLVRGVVDQCASYLGCCGLSLEGQES